MLHGIVEGRVQGIGYRWFVQRSAGTLGLSGWVKNLPGGGVEIEAEGEKEILEGFLDSLRTGHPGAFVKDIKTAWSNSKERSYSGFEIKF